MTTHENEALQGGERQDTAQHGGGGTGAARARAGQARRRDARSAAWLPGTPSADRERSCSRRSANHQSMQPNKPLTGREAAAAHLGLVGRGRHDALETLLGAAQRGAQAQGHSAARPLSAPLQRDETAAAASQPAIKRSGQE